MQNISFREIETWKTGPEFWTSPPRLKFISENRIQVGNCIYDENFNSVTKFSNYCTFLNDSSAVFVKDIYADRKICKRILQFIDFEKESIIDIGEIKAHAQTYHKIISTNCDAIIYIDAKSTYLGSTTPSNGMFIFYDLNRKTTNIYAENYFISADVLSDSIIVTLDYERELKILNINSDEPVSSCELNLPMERPKIIPINQRCFAVAGHPCRFFNLINISEKGEMFVGTRNEDAMGAFRNATLISPNLMVFVTTLSISLWALPRIAGEQARLLHEQALPKHKISKIIALPSDDPNVGRLIVAGHRRYLAYWEVEHQGLY